MFRFFPVPALALIAWASAAVAQAPRDAVFVNARVYTVNAEQPTASAFSVRGGKFMEVGTNEFVLGAAEAGTQVLDLGGRTVVPGFIDAHGHLLALGMGLHQVDVTGTTSYEQVIAAVAARAAETPDGQWVLGRGWDQNDWAVKEFPTHAALSAATPSHPVSVTRIDGHALLANAVALARAGITAQTPDPEGGKIIRDAEGVPTGVLVDTAMGLVRKQVPTPDFEERREFLRSAMVECLVNGVTTVHDAGVDVTTIVAYRALIAANQFPFRVYAMISSTDQPTLNQYLKSGPVISDADGRLTVRCIKVIADGALGSRGAALLAPYSDDPANSGLLIVQQKELEDLTSRALTAGFQVATHAIGDRTNRMVLNAYENALAANGIAPKGNDKRLRIEHAQIVNPDDIPRFAALGIVPSMQTTHCTSDMPWVADRIGLDRLKGAYAWQRFLKNGSRIANGSDFPVESVNPLRGFYAAITRQDANGQPPDGWQPEQRMSRIEALRSYTLDAAYAGFEEGVKGSIETGKYADFVVLSANIMEIPPMEILGTRVEMTFVGGKTVYTAP